MCSVLSSLLHFWTPKSSTTLATSIPAVRISGVRRVSNLQYLLERNRWRVEDHATVYSDSSEQTIPH